MFYIVVLIAITLLATVGWALNGLTALSETDRIMTAYIDWKYEDFAHVDERNEPVDITTLFEAVQTSCEMHSDPFEAFSDANKEPFRQWYAANKNRYE